MINDFNDFCTWMYVVVDDIWLKIAPFFKRPGPAPECPDKGDAYTAAEVDGCRQPHLVVHSAPQERQLRALVQASQHTEADRQRVDGLGVEPHELMIGLAHPSAREVLRNPRAITPISNRFETAELSGAASLERFS